MPGDLWLQDRKPGDLTLRRDRPGADLWLHRRAPGDLRLRHPGDRQADLHAPLPALRSLIEANQPNLAQAELHPDLPPLQSQLQAEYANRAELAALLPPIASHLDAAYDNAVWRGVESRAQADWEAAPEVCDATCSGYQDTRRLKPVTCAPWTGGASRPAETLAAFAGMDASPTDICIPARAGKTLAIDPCAGWVDLLRSLRPSIKSPAQPGRTLAISPCAGWIDLYRTARPSPCNPFQSAVLLIQRWCGDYRDGLRTRLNYCWDWRAGRIRYGWGGPIVIYVPPVPPEPPCGPIGEADLILVQSRSATLILEPCVPVGDRPPENVVIPIRRVYIVANDVHLIRVSDNLELPVFSMSASIDVDSWAWQFSAELPADQLANVQPGTDPVEVEVQINTYAWRFLVEDIRRSRSFGKSRIQISGRGTAARLDVPYAGIINRTNTADLNATQILDDLLTDNGVPIGWAIDWQLTDWLVSAFAWNHSGTYMAGVLKVAEAAGAVVQADRTAQTLHLIHRYPVAPWDWQTATPAYTIPEAIVTTEGIAWQEKPPYNAAYVSGETLGILGHIVRTGTAGDLVAPLVTHPLITHDDAARQTGIRILADTGRQALYTLSMPLDPGGTGLGLLEPCLLIEYGPSAVRGLIRSTQVEAKPGSVRQTITLETTA